MAEAIKSNFSKSTFVDQLKNVTPSNEFYAYVEVPAAIAARAGLVDQFKKKISFAATSTSVPDMSISPISVPFRSTSISIPGDKDSTGQWSLSIRCDIDFIVRDVFEIWNDAIVGNVDNSVIDDFDLDATGLFGIGEIHQLTKNGRILKTWILDGVWPATVAGVRYDWSQSNGIVTFDVTMAYQHVESNTTRANEIFDGGAS